MSSYMVYGGWRFRFFIWRLKLRWFVRDHFQSRLRNRVRQLEEEVSFLQDELHYVERGLIEDITRIEDQIPEFQAW